MSNDAAALTAADLDVLRRPRYAAELAPDDVRLVVQLDTVRRFTN